MVGTDAPHSGERSVGRGGHVRVTPGLDDRAFQIVDRVGRRDRAQLSAQPPKPDQHSRAIDPGRQSFRETVEEWEDVRASVARRRVEIGSLDQAARSSGLVVLGREGGGTLGDHGSCLGSTTHVEAGRSLLELGCDSLARCLRRSTEVQRALVGVVQRGRERQMDSATLRRCMCLEKRRGEERWANHDPP